MEYFDIAVIVVVAFSALIGFTRGLTREVLGLLSWVAALAASYFGFPFAKKIALDYIHNPNIAEYVSYFSVFIIFLILFSIVSNILSSLIRQTMLSGIDRMLGFGFGIIRSFLLLSFIDIGMGMFFSKAQEPAFIENSKSIKHVHMLGENLMDSLPDWVVKMIKEKQKNPDSLKETQKEPQKSPEELKKEQELNAEILSNLSPHGEDDRLNDKKEIASDVVESVIDDVKKKAIDSMSDMLD